MRMKPKAIHDAMSCDTVYFLLVSDTWGIRLEAVSLEFSSVRQSVLIVVILAFAGLAVFADYDSQGFCHEFLNGDSEGCMYA